MTDRNEGVDKVWFGGQVEKISFGHAARSVPANLQKAMWHRQFKVRARVYDTGQVLSAFCNK